MLYYLKFLVELTSRAGDIHSAGYASLAVLHTLDDARRLVALGVVGGLRRVHCFLAITCFGNFGHGSGASPLKIVSAHTRNARGFNGAVDTHPSCRLCGRQADSLPLSLHQASPS